MSRNERGFLRWYRVMPMLAVSSVSESGTGPERSPSS